MIENPEVVFINFKKQGIKAALNKSDFNPEKHVLWTEKEEAKYKQKPKTEGDNERPAATRG